MCWRSTWEYAFDIILTQGLSSSICRCMLHMLDSPSNDLQIESEANTAQICKRFTL